MAFGHICRCLQEPFTLPQLQRTYEIVLGHPMDNSGFRKRMLDAQFLIEEGSISGSPGARPWVTG